MKKMLIGLTGRAGSGKDTVAAILLDQAYRKVAFADPIKEAMCAMLGITRSQIEDREYKEALHSQLVKSPRFMMQTLGTEWGRELIHPNIWLILAEKRIEAFLQYRNVVVTDVRFENEAEMIRNKGGIIIHIDRSSKENTTIYNTHKSESGIKPNVNDYIFYNNVTLEDLPQKVRNFFSSLEAHYNDITSSNFHP